MWEIDFSLEIMRIRRQAHQKANGRPSRNGPVHCFRSAEMRPLPDVAERLSASVFGHVLRLLGCKIVLLDLFLNLLRGMIIKSAGRRTRRVHPWAAFRESRDRGG